MCCRFDFSRACGDSGDHTLVVYRRYLGIGTAPGNRFICRISRFYRGRELYLIADLHFSGTAVQLYGGHGAVIVSSFHRAVNQGEAAEAADLRSGGCSVYRCVELCSTAVFVTVEKGFFCKSGRNSDAERHFPLYVGTRRQERYLIYLQRAAICSCLKRVIFFS